MRRISVIPAYIKKRLTVSSLSNSLEDDQTLRKQESIIIDGFITHQAKAQVEK